MNLTLSLEERDQLIRIVDMYYTELHTEVHRTDLHDMKEHLSREEKLVASILQRIKQLKP